METTEEIGAEAANVARDKTLKLLNEKGPSLDRILLRLRQALIAKETKTHYDKDLGEWQYSSPLIAHSIRVQAIKIALDLYDAMPSQKIDVKGELTLPDELEQAIIDKITNKGK